MADPSQSATRNNVKEHGRHVSIALAIKEPRPAGTCPTAEELATLVENRLGRRVRHRLLKHLAACPECYSLWLEAARHEEQPAAAKRFSLRWQFQPWVPLGAALAACLLLIFWSTAPFDQAKLPKLLESSYQNLAQSANSAEFSELARQQDFPWEEPNRAYGLAPATITIPARAFAAGLWRGRADLTGGSNPMPPAFRPPLETGSSWEPSAWGSYFGLGRWLVAAKVAALQTSALPEGFWFELRETSLLLKRSLADRDTTEQEAQWASEPLTRVAALLQQVSEQGPTARQRRQLLKETDQLLSQLAPSLPN
ncbi:MAG: hypothetical protein BA870_12110 [Desulfuromonadales bacterium C00003094]|jgi:hypothetical protein|nr:MAG: hypothetical protein BA870_12110 [Desulfuromonadales bacterium C00003094]OEU77255.1 MAG: hypothetical protein BA869_08135 [Desulfuromonadales bacterium C00003107]